MLDDSSCFSEDQGVIGIVGGLAVPGFHVGWFGALSGQVPVVFMFKLKFMLMFESMLCCTAVPYWEQYNNLHLITCSCLPEGAPPCATHPSSGRSQAPFTVYPLEWAWFFICTSTLSHVHLVTLCVSHHDHHHPPPAPAPRPTDSLFIPAHSMSVI